jgi:hypothetical protein
MLRADASSWIRRRRGLTRSSRARSFTGQTLTSAVSMNRSRSRELTSELPGIEGDRRHIHVGRSVTEPGAGGRDMHWPRAPTTCAWQRRILSRSSTMAARCRGSTSVSSRSRLSGRSRPSAPRSARIPRCGYGCGLRQRTRGRGSDPWKRTRPGRRVCDNDHGRGSARRAFEDSLDRPGLDSIERFREARPIGVEPAPARRAARLLRRADHQQLRRRRHQQGHGHQAPRLRTTQLQGLPRTGAPSMRLNRTTRRHPARSARTHYSTGTRGSAFART